jgi:uncharacterized membrane protein YkoI
MKRIFLILAYLAGSLLTASSLCTAGTVKSDIPADLARQAKVSLETARATALAKVPNGTVKSEELEKEHDRLIYSFDIQVPGKSGIEEVNVDAIDGKVLGVEHESARTERREKAKEHKEHHPPGH